MKKILIGLAILALLSVAGAAFADDSAAVNLTVQPYAWCSFAGNAGDVSAWNHSQYGADPANDIKTAFTISVNGHGGEGSDVLNVAWECNTAAYFQTALAVGTLPGTWSLLFDGAGWQSPNQLYITDDPPDVGQKIVAPMTLKVTGIDISTDAGSYSGTLSLTCWPVP